MFADPHPDSAWSVCYVAPRGVEGEPCRHSAERIRVGPSSGEFMLLTYSCRWCCRILRSVDDLTWRQYDWVRRWNRRC